MTNKKKSTGMSRHERNEHLTNWYMINLGWGVAGILGLTFIYYGYRNVNTILAMQPLMWVLFGLFTAGTVTVFMLSKLGKIKNQKRGKNYAALLGVCALASLWLSLYNKLRPVMETCARAILRRPNLTVSSYWNVWIPMIAIVVYLIIAFIYYVIQIAKK